MKYNLPADYYVFPIQVKNDSRGCPLTFILLKLIGLMKKVIT